MKRSIASSTAEPRAGLASIEEVLRLWLKANKVSKRIDQAAVFEQWKVVVGRDLADHTRVVDISEGELIVEVDSAPLLQELSTYYQRELLESLQQNEVFRGIHRIRFRAGSF